MSDSRTALAPSLVGSCTWMSTLAFEAPPLNRGEVRDAVFGLRKDAVGGRKPEDFRCAMV